MTVYVCKPGIDPGCVDMSAMKFPTAEEFPPLPPFLSNISQPVRKQNVQFQVIAGTGDGSIPPGANSEFAIWVKGKNGGKPLQFDEQCAAFTEPIGSSEEWTLSQNLNQGGLPFHVFHIHTNPFQLDEHLHQRQARLLFDVPGTVRRIPICVHHADLGGQPVAAQQRRERQPAGCDAPGNGGHPAAVPRLHGSVCSALPLPWP